MADTKRSLLGIYSYAVCFAALIGLVIVIVSGAYSAIRIAAPEFTASQYALNGMDDNDEYWRKIVSRDAYLKGKDPSYSLERPAEAELTAKRLAERDKALKYIQREASVSLVQLAIWFLALVPIFYLHWRLARRESVTRD